MKHTFETDFTRYLAAKKSIDDRSLNRNVFESLRREIQMRQPRPPLSVLEIGAGIGTMIERLREWGLSDGAATITAIDADAGNIEEARRRLSSKTGGIELEAIDVFEFARREQGRRRWDVVVAHAFLDLVDVPALLPLVRGLLSDEGLLYATINFDGVTSLEPEIDPALDRQIEALYHQTMDERLVSGRRSGDSRTGRRLFGQLETAGFRLVDAGGSDWVIFPRAHAYADDDAYFLHCIIHTLHEALRDHHLLDSAAFAHWIDERHGQVERGELVFIAHQLDVLATWGG